MNYDWMKETNWKENLEGNIKIMADIIGIELLGKLFESFSKSYVYFSEKELFKLKKDYIMTHQHFNAPHIAETINSCERFVYKTIRGNNDNESSRNIITKPKPRVYQELDLSENTL